MTFNMYDLKSVVDNNRTYLSIRQLLILSKCRAVDSVLINYHKNGKKVGVLFDNYLVQDTFDIVLERKNNLERTTALRLKATNMLLHYLKGRLDERN